MWDTYRDGTRTCYDAMYRRAVDDQDGKAAADVSASDISEHLQRLANQKMSVRSVKALRTIYRQIFQNAIIDEHFGKYVKTNPALNVPIPRNATPAVKRQAPEDDIVSAIREKAATAYWGAFAMFLISTGFRRGEALAIQWKDIDNKANTITCSKSVSYKNSTAKVGETKTDNALRTVPLLPDLAAVLKKPKGAKPNHFVFCGDNPAEPMPQATFHRHWEHYCKDMGFVVCVLSEQRISKQNHKYTYAKYKSTLTPHVLRHGYATMLYDAGVDPYTAQKLLGHANIETTLAIYTHLSQQKKNASIKKLTDFAKCGYKTVV